MIESWLQVTCNVCGETDFADYPNMTYKLMRSHLRELGWRNNGGLDYCPNCVAGGAWRQRENIFEDRPNTALLF